MSSEVDALPSTTRRPAEQGGHILPLWKGSVEDKRGQCTGNVDSVGGPIVEASPLTVMVPSSRGLWPSKKARSCGSLSRLYGK